MKFAESYYTSIGKRVFNVWIEGREAIKELDLFALVGKDTAYDFSQVVNVTDEMLYIKFESVVGNPIVCGILIEALD